MVFNAVYFIILLTFAAFFTACGEGRHVKQPGAEVAADVSEQQPSTGAVVAAELRTLCKTPTGQTHEPPCDEGPGSRIVCLAQDGTEHPLPCRAEDGEIRLVYEPAARDQDNDSITPPPPATNQTEQPECIDANGVRHAPPCRDGRDGVTTIIRDTSPIQLACTNVGQGNADWLAQAMNPVTVNALKSNNGTGLPYFLMTPGRTRPARTPHGTPISLEVLGLNEGNVHPRPRSSVHRDSVHNAMVLFNIPVGLPVDRSSIQDDSTFAAILNLNFFNMAHYPHDTDVLCLLCEGHRI